MSARYRTAHKHGYQPAGMVVEVITLSLTGGPKSEHNRDYGIGGDGQWLLVKYPNGIMCGQVRTPAELAMLGISLADLEEAS